MELRLERIAEWETEKGKEMAYRFVDKMTSGVTMSFTVTGDAAYVCGMVGQYGITAVGDVLEVALSRNKQMKMGDS